MGSPTRRHRNTHTKTNRIRLTDFSSAHPTRRLRRTAPRVARVPGTSSPPGICGGVRPHGKTAFFSVQRRIPEFPVDASRWHRGGRRHKKNGAHQQAFRSPADVPRRGGVVTFLTPLGRLETVEKREEQIGTRQDESQWIVAQRPLSAPTIPRFDTIVCRGFPHSMMRTALNTDPFNGKQGTCDISRSSYICSCSHGVEEEHSMSAWILA